jgi:hypothetical protein
MCSVKWRPVQQDDRVHLDTVKNENWIAKQARNCVAKGPGVACKQRLKEEPCVWIEVEEHLTEVTTI